MSVHSSSPATRCSPFARRLTAIVLSSAALLLGGCETIKTYRTHPDFSERIAAMGAPAAFPAEIHIKRLATGGVPEEVDEYSEEATRLFAVSLSKAGLDGSDATFATIAIDSENQAEFDEVMALAKTVFSNMHAFAYFDQYPGFKHKVADFRYSVGDLSALLDGSQAEAALFIFGDDYFTTSGRKALNGMKTLLLAAAGVGYVGMEGSGFVYAMLLSKDGEVLWVDQHLDTNLDLRQQKDIDQVVAYFTGNLRRAKEAALVAPAE